MAFAGERSWLAAGHVAWSGQGRVPEAFTPLHCSGSDSRPPPKPPAPAPSPQGGTGQAVLEKGDWNRELSCLPLFPLTSKFYLSEASSRLQAGR